MPETKEDIVQYQWIKGDKQGTVETLQSNDGKWITFQSGRRCNKDLVKEFLMKIDTDNPILQFDDPVQSTKKPAKKVAKQPKKKIEFGEVAAKMIEEKLQSPSIPLIEKAKTTKTKLNVRINCDLPSKAFIEVLEESFDEDIIKDLAEFLVSKIEDPKQYLIDNMKRSILEWYKYNNKTNKREN
jgi:hypothetical protein